MTTPAAAGIGYIETPKIQDPVPLGNDTPITRQELHNYFKFLGDQANNQFQQIRQEFVNIVETGTLPWGDDIQDVGAANAGGSSAEAAREDHVHEGVHAVIEDDSAIVGDWTLDVTQNLSIETAGNTTTITGPDLTPYVTTDTKPLWLMFEYEVGWDGAATQVAFLNVLTALSPTPLEYGIVPAGSVTKLLAWMHGHTTEDLVDPDAGTLTVTVTKNGVSQEDPAVVLQDGTTKAQDTGSVAFAALDKIGVQVATNAAYESPDAESATTVYVLVKLEET